MRSVDYTFFIGIRWDHRFKAVGFLAIAKPPGLWFCFHRAMIGLALEKRQ
jgi:hypothetical protein